MIVKLIIIVLSVALSAMMSAVMDKLQFHYSHSIFARLKPLFWNPAISWKNKYKNGDPTKGAKFPGSTSVFVSLTDAWHLAKKVFTAAIAVPFTFSVSTLWPLSGWWWFGVWVGMQLLFGAVFHIFFHRLFEQKVTKE